MAPGWFLQHSEPWLIKELVMRTRLAAFLGTCVVASMVSLSSGLAWADDAVPTEDVLYMNDLRELRGQIISETPSEIVFEFVDRKLNLRSKLTIKKADIAKIVRDIPLATPESAPATGSAGSHTGAASGTASGVAKSDETPASSYGIKRAADISEHTKRIYVVPMDGQMGTDVNAEVYEEVVSDIRAQNPDYLIIKLRSRDTEDRLYTRWGREEQSANDSEFLDRYRELVSLFRDELRDIPQVVWIEDSEGISSVIAMAWPDMYMMPGARLGGLARAAGNFLGVKDDFNTLGKYREAYMAWLKGFAEYGGYDLKLLDAMVRPEFLLSASWKGRNVDWTLDANGEYLVDGSEDFTVAFRAKSAEDFGISKGTAETLDDLALLLGVREYVVLDSQAQAHFDKYKEDWRRVLDQCQTLWNDHTQFLGWATGEDTVRYLGRAKDCLEKIVAAIDRYEAVEVRLARNHGISKTYLTIMIEQMNEQLRAARGGGRNAGAGAAGGGGTGRGSGPRGR